MDNLNCPLRLAVLLLISAVGSWSPLGRVAHADDARLEQALKKHKRSPMVRRFQDPEKWAKRWDSGTRDRWQQPEKVIDLLKLKKNAWVVDLGAGTGYFSVRLARAVPAGQVWALDVESKMVAHTAKRAKGLGLKNLRAQTISHKGFRLPHVVDMIFVCNVYHHLKNRIRYFKRTLDGLKRNGRLVVVDFKSGKIPVGPPGRHRVTPRQLDRELSQAGYQRIEVFDKVLPYQYVAIYQPSSKMTQAPKTVTRQHSLNSAE